MKKKFLAPRPLITIWLVSCIMHATVVVVVYYVPSYLLYWEMTTMNDICKYHAGYTIYEF